MADLLSGAGTQGGAGSLGLGLMKYLSAIRGNANARAQNATNDKWGPLLALNTKGGGAKNREVPTASFSDIMGPAFASAMGSAPAPGGSVTPEEEMMGAPARGGNDPGYAGGGYIGGGKIPGKQMVPGDSPLNDTKMIAASPGEVMLPKSVAGPAMKGNKWKVAAYLQEIKRHGPGPMPAKGMSSGMQASKPKSSSISPWQAMCGGGKV